MSTPLIITIAGLLVHISTTSECFTLETYVPVVSTIQRYYYTECVFLLYPGRKQYEGNGFLTIQLQEASLLVNLQALASGGSVPMATLDMQHLVSGWEEDICTRNRPLFVVVIFNNVTTRLLYQVFQNRSLSKPRWLVFLDNASPEDTFRDVNIPFDCEFLVARPAGGQGVQLIEVYRVSRTLPLLTYPWGSWMPGSGLQGPPVGLYSRRNDLQGITIKALAIHNLPTVDLRKGNVSGLTREIYSILERKLNFRYFVYIREPQDTEWNWRTFVNPFSSELWLAVLLSILLLSSILLLQQISVLRYGNDVIDKCILCSYCEALYYVMAIFSSQGHWTTPRSWSGRLIYMVSYVTAVILWAAYSANLVAYLTEKPPSRLTITSFQELLQEKSYQFTVVKNGPEQHYFQNTQDPVLHEVFLRKLQSNLVNMPMTGVDGLERVCKRKETFLSHTGVLEAARPFMSCNVVPLPDAKYYATTSGLVLSKGGPYNKFILHSLEELRSSGILKKIVRDNGPRTNSPVEHNFFGITLLNVATIFIILIVAIFTSTLIFLIRILDRKSWVKYLVRLCRINTSRGPPSPIPTAYRDGINTN